MRMHLVDAGTNRYRKWADILKLYLANTVAIHFEDVVQGLKVFISTANPSECEPVQYAHHLSTDVGRAQYGYIAAHEQPNILISYHYFKTIDLDKLFGYFPRRPNVFADSGAYSAQSLGVPINLGEYERWIDRWRHWFDVYANLDVIGDYEATSRNQQLMEEHGYSPLPAFHIGEPFEVLDKLCDDYCYIGLGGMVGYGAAPLKWLIRCFRIAKERSVFHGYGVNGVQPLKSLPFYSVDSSGWGAAFRYGRLTLFDPAAGNFRSAYVGDRKGCYKHARLFRQYGFDPEDFADRQRYSRNKAAAISALSYMMFGRWCTKRHGEIILPRREVA
jgi:hypothetical protein